MMTESPGDTARLVYHIRREHKYEEPLPEKAIHKLLYLSAKKADEYEVPVCIPYFWYRYGTLSPIPSEHAMEDGTSNVPPYDEELRRLATDALDQYYATSLEELTDYMYQFAPYEVQRDWRDLDKKLRTHHPDYPDFFEVEPSRRSIRDSAKAVYNTFPLTQYPEYETDLTRWYATISRELYNDKMHVDRMMNVNVKFWGIFAITLAKEHRHKMGIQDVKRVLSIDSLDETQDRYRERIRELDSGAVQEKFDEYELDEAEARAADALSNTLVE